jgi:uncharacterized protein (DUF362 family)
VNVKPKVYINQTSFPDPTWDDFKKSAYDLLSGIEFDPPLDRKIVIKPNLVNAFTPDSGIITHPGFVHGVVKYLKEKGVKGFNIIIAEGGGTERDRLILDQLKTSHYEELIREEKISFVNLNFESVVPTPVHKGIVFKSIGLAELVADKEVYLINMPKLKCHNFARLTFAIKNMMGIIVPIENRHLCRPIPGKDGIAPPVLEDFLAFGHKLIDLYLARAPQLNIGEGIIGRDGTGFRRGTNHVTNFALASENSLALDIVAAFLVGIPYEGLPYVIAAKSRGISPTELEDVESFILTDGEFQLAQDLSLYKYKEEFKVVERTKDQPPGTPV